jgi:hypothetical protein
LSDCSSPGAGGKPLVPEEEHFCVTRINFLTKKHKDSYVFLILIKYIPGLSFNTLPFFNNAKKGGCHAEEDRCA